MPWTSQQPPVTERSGLHSHASKQRQGWEGTVGMRSHTFSRASEPTAGPPPGEVRQRFPSWTWGRWECSPVPPRLARRHRERRVPAMHWPSIQFRKHLLSTSRLHVPGIVLSNCFLNGMSQTAPRFDHRCPAHPHLPSAAVPTSPPALTLQRRTTLSRVPLSRPCSAPAPCPGTPPWVGKARTPWPDSGAGSAGAGEPARGQGGS